VIALLSLALVRLEPDCCIWFWTLQFEKSKTGERGGGERKRVRAKARRG